VNHKASEIIRTLLPGYFAFVMATGIVASGLNAFGYGTIARVLFVLGILGYLKLWVLSICRVVRYPVDMWADFTSFSRGPGFFTTVAGTGILGAVAIRLYDSTVIAFGLLCFDAVLWFVMSYLFATVVVVSAEKPTAERGVNGGWLVIVVATQSLSVLSALLNDRIPLFIPVALFVTGCATYLLLISLIVSRLILTKVDVADLAPPYWIMMGAASISCLAGVELNKHSATWGLNVNAFPVLQAVTLFFWIVATGWIPLLVCLGVWRHVIKRAPLGYEPQLWSIVFPLGMYAFATFSVSEYFKLPFIEPIASTFLAIACLAWVIVLCGMLRSAYRVIR